ncbi:MAG: hypothetical protein LBN93_01705 [Candidatus Symbiothrix sp.]|nr:hypothetical protein [Candidatus Symbiothrix sp.]
MDEKNKRIKPNGLFSPPVVPAGYEADNYGLSNFYMPTLAEIQLPITNYRLLEGEESHSPNSESPNSESPVNKSQTVKSQMVESQATESLTPAPEKEHHTNYWPAAIISVLLLLLLCIVAAPLISPAWSVLKEKLHITQPADAQSLEETELPVLEQKTDSIAKSNTAAVPEKPAYYMIVASLSTETEAQEELKRLQKTAFPEAQLMTLKRGFGISACKFDTKQDADDFLTVFKKERPQYKDAWILFQ